MTGDVKDSQKDTGKLASQTSAYSHMRNIFAVPGPVRQLFDRFPLITYPANELPQRSPQRRAEHSLYIFTTSKGAQDGEPSFNPTCLKWQTYLKFAGIQFRTISSTNHASPTGALPFLLSSAPDNTSAPDSTLPIASNKLHKWVNERRVTLEEPSDVRYDVYLTLLDYRIRNAWLYTLYLEPRNFTAIARRLYVVPCSSVLLVSTTIAYQLRAAAEAEILKHSMVIDVDDIYSEANKAFDALSTLLGEDKFFFGNMNPGLFDAAVFAYTHLLLEERMEWKETRLMKGLKKHENLIAHRRRIHDTYYHATSS